MKMRKRNILAFSLLALLPIATSCSSGVKVPNDWAKLISFEQDGQTAYNKLKDVKRNGKYVTYETYLPSSLNSATTMQAEDSKYIANIVDGLVEVDRTGNLVPALAKSYSWNADSTELTLNIREGVKWVKNGNKGRDVYIDSTGSEAVVSAHDWVSSAKYVLDAASGSESSYLLTMFIEGAEEYNTYTTFKFYQSLGYGLISPDLLASFEATDKESSDEKVKAAYATCSRNVGRVSPTSGTCGKYTDPGLINDEYIAAALGLEVDTLPQVANFSRVGVKASEDGKKLTYKLLAPAPYFLTVLTYTPYLPIYAPFVEAIGGIENFGTSKDKVLVNGAYVMANFKMGTAKSLDFERNSSYWDLANVRNYTVRVLSIPKNFSPSSMRSAYENKDISAFVVNSLDQVGWNRYVVGDDPNNPGTIDNPAHKDAHMVEGLGDGSSFAFMLNLNRDTSKAGQANTLMGSEAEFQKYNSDGENTTVLNTNKALSNSPALRKLVLKSIDTHVYGDSMGSDDYTKSKYMINTWIPANFIKYEEYDEKTDPAQGIRGADFVNFTKKAFVDKFYEGKYTDENFAKADAALGYSQHSTGEHAIGFDTVRPDASKWAFELSETGKADLAALKAEAKKEIDEYNATHAADPIKTPVLIETSGLYYDQRENQDSGAWINYSNYRANGCWIDDGKYDSDFSKPSSVKVCSKEEADNALFRIIKNKANNITDATVYQTLATYTRMSLVISAWGPDYSDPLTFAQCVVSDGDLVSNIGNTKDVDNPNHEAIAKQWEKYDGLVEAAAADLNSRTRFEKFAEAEIELLYELAIVRPIYMVGLGKAVQVSKIVPFRAPRAIYGITQYKYKYTEILTRTISKQEYLDLRDERLVVNSTQEQF